MSFFARVVYQKLIEESLGICDQVFSGKDARVVYQKLIEESLGICDQ